MIYRDGQLHANNRVWDGFAWVASSPRKYNLGYILSRYYFVRGITFRSHGWSYASGYYDAIDVADYIRESKDYRVAAARVLAFSPIRYIVHNGKVIDETCHEVKVDGARTIEQTLYTLFCVKGDYTIEKA